MNVTYGLTYESDGGYRKHSTNLGFADLVRLVDEGKVEGYHIEDSEDYGVRILDEMGERMTVAVAHRVLTAQAAILEWNLAAADDGADQVFAKEKMSEWLARARILHL
jgi:hypothetical protein